MKCFVILAVVLAIFVAKGHARVMRPMWLVRGGAVDSNEEKAVTTPAGPNVECKDGVCEIKGGEEIKTATSSSGPMSTAEMKEMAALAASTELMQNKEDEDEDEDELNRKVDEYDAKLKLIRQQEEDLISEVKKLGWDSEEDIKVALKKAHGDVTAANEMLEREEEEREEIRAEANILSGEGRWVSLTFKWLLLYTVGVLFPIEIEWCITQLCYSSVISYNITSIAYNHHTDIPLFNLILKTVPRGSRIRPFGVW